MQLKLFMVPVKNVTAAEAEVNAFLRGHRVRQRFGVAAKGLQPCVTGRQLEQQRQQLPDGEPQQQQPDEQQQQPRVSVGAALSSTLRPDGGGADPAAILSSKRSVTRQRSADEGLVLVAEGPPRNLRAFGRQPTALARKTPSKLT